MPALDLASPHLVGLAAGVLILAVGLFVLLARPHSPLHQLFFVLAVVDGASTALYRLRLMALDPALAAYFEATQWYFYVAFVALLFVFGALFPRRIEPRSAFWGLVGVALAGGLAVTVAYAAERAWLWTSRIEDGRFLVDDTPLANALRAAFSLATVLIVAKLTRDVLRDRSASHRRQSAFVLGGMALAYAPYALTSLTGILARNPAAVVDLARPDRVLVYWVFAGLAGAVAASAWLLSTRPEAEARGDARFVLGAYAGVASLTLLSLVVPTREFASALRAIALLAYPVLLGYAIARYEVFDIDAKLRRAATVTLVAGLLTGSFIVMENAVEGVFQDRLAAGVSSQFLAGSVAAIVTALAFVPVVRMSRRATAKLIPELSHDELHLRKLEIYRHSLAGAYADGILKEGESRTLAALRESLGITQREHDAMMREVVPA